MSEIAWLLLAAALCIAGFATLGWLRPSAVVLTSAQLMLLLGAAGMLTGLWFDARQGNLALLASICLGGPRDVAGTLVLHWTHLPAMHIGMVVGGLATVPLLRRYRRTCRRQFCARLAQNLLCSAWMVLGMAAGTMAFLQLASRAGAGLGQAVMLGSMAAGMVWGMVVSVSVYRLWIRTRPRFGAAV